MLKFEAKGEKTTISMNLPTNLDEITPEYLKAVTNDVIVADDYSLIGLLYRETLAGVILANNQKKGKQSMNVIPVFIKAGKTDSEYIKAIDCKDSLIIASSDISIGYHVVCPKNKITISQILNYCSIDKNAYKNAITISKKADPCYFLEFKLVPNCAIHGCYKKDNDNIENPFIAITTEG